MRPQVEKANPRDIKNMRKAIKDLKNKCRSVNKEPKMSGGRKIYKMLHSIREKEDLIVDSSSEDSHVSVIGQADNI